MSTADVLSAVAFANKYKMHVNSVQHSVALKASKTCKK